MYTKTSKGVVPSELYKERMSAAPIGSFWAVLRADPWTQKTLETGLNPQSGAKALNALQKYAIDSTRLGIPILFAEECPHGHMAIGTTVFPTSLVQASTWDKELMYKMGETIALEARLQGANIGYGPVLDIAREPRWSRMEETFGEDPVLTSTLGVAFMKGMQGEVQMTENIFSPPSSILLLTVSLNPDTMVHAPMSVCDNYFQTICILSRKQWKQEQAQS